MTDLRSDPQSFARAVSDEAKVLLRLAAERRLLLRLTGSLAIRSHCAGSSHLLETLGRRPYRDIDLMGVWKQNRDVSHMFEERGYVQDPEMKQAQEFGVKRLIHEHPATGIKIDVFMDDLVMAHTVPFGHRLELDDPTISVTDLLLSKLQIHEITENDLIDTVVLIADHDLGAGERERIDDAYVASLLSRDWGFWYTTLLNLEKLQEAVARYDALPPETAAAVDERLVRLKTRIDDTPKSGKWKLRARVGTRARWYEEVAEVHR
jgi:hypothetical protein